jgi:hypothetical protein
LGEVRPTPFLPSSIARRIHRASSPCMDIERPFSGNLRKPLESLLMLLQLPANFPDEW